MSSDTYPKKVQVSMTGAQHEALRELAYRSRVSMQECVRRFIEASDQSGCGNVGRDDITHSEPVSATIKGGVEVGETRVGNKKK